MDEKRGANEWNDVYGSLGETSAPRLMQLPLHVLDPWERNGSTEQPFRPYTPEKLQELADNISLHGVLEPIRVRPMPSGRFQILAGRNRWEASKLAGRTTIPAIVEEVDDDKAAEILVDSNLQHRDLLLPSEKAFAYKLKLEAIRAQGRRTDLTSDQTGPKLSAAEKIAQGNRESGSSIKRYIRLTYLLPALLGMVDEGTIPFLAGVELSFLDTDAQAMLLRIMASCKLKTIRQKQAEALHRAVAIDGGLSEEDILAILGLAGEEESKGFSMKIQLGGIDKATYSQLKKDSTYLYGLQAAMEEFTRSYLKEREEILEKIGNWVR